MLSIDISSSGDCTVFPEQWQLTRARHTRLYVDGEGARMARGGILSNGVGEKGPSKHLPSGTHH